MKYLAVINQQSYEVEIDNDGNILVNGEARDGRFPQPRRLALLDHHGKQIAGSGHR